jgi:hypothetical protein
LARRAGSGGRPELFLTGVDAVLPEFCE